MYAVGLSFTLGFDHRPVKGCVMSGAKGIHRMYPDKFIPLYTRVAFTTTPYAEALEEADRLADMLRQVLALPNIEVEWASLAVEKVIHQSVQTR